MNVADTEIVISLLQDSGYSHCSKMEEADILLINTCSIRENAEQRVWGRLDIFRREKRNRPGALVGVIGCMAERLKERLLEREKMIDLVVGPDAYRQLPRLIEEAGTGQKGVNVLLSQEETYADITPVRLSKNGVSAFIAIMRGCNNLCSYCVVPYTRGEERSRDPRSIVAEAEDLAARGFREITLLGQNVDSYSYSSGSRKVDFSTLLEMVAKVDRGVRIRFSTNHPKDISEKLLQTMAGHPNICRHIHLPLQSGSSRILSLMKRSYTREAYIGKVKLIRRLLPDCAISTDIITGFCTESDSDHTETLTLMEWAGFDFAYMFAYSERPGTYAAGNLPDDVPETVKKRRLREIIELQGDLSLRSKRALMGSCVEVLVEGVSKRSQNHLFGRNSYNQVVVFPSERESPGDYLNVTIEGYTSATLTGRRTGTANSTGSQ